MAATTALRGVKKKVKKKKQLCYPHINLVYLYRANDVWDDVQFMVLLTESGSNLRYMMADTLISTQHRHWAVYLIGQEELNKRVDSYWKQFDKFAEIKDQKLVQVNKPVETKVVEKSRLSKSNRSKGKISKASC